MLRHIFVQTLTDCIWGFGLWWGRGGAGGGSGEEEGWREYNFLAV